MNRVALALLTVVTLAACPEGGESTQRLWLDAREGADPRLTVEHPPRF